MDTLPRKDSWGRKGQMIEQESLTLIAGVLDYYAIPSYGRFLVERAVHATADFSIAPLFQISPGFVEKALDSLSSPLDVFCDVEMVKSGLSRHLLNASSVRSQVLVNHPECLEGARRNNLTRSETAVDLACARGIRVFIFGNAPTGVLRLIHHIHQGYPADWVIAVPVGFIKAAESKEQLLALSTASIVLRGPRGGSPVACSIMNALLKAKGTGETRANRPDQGNHE